MHQMNIVLNEKDDRVINLDIKTANGQQYSVGIEILQHEFGLCNDDVQVSVHKIKNSEDGQCPRVVYGPNQILYRERPVATKKHKNSTINASVWYEFHSIGDIPAVFSDK